MEFEGKFAVLVQKFSKGNYGYVIKEAKNLLLQYPENTRLLNILGSSYSKSGNLKDAISSFVLSEEKDPSNLNTQRNLAQIYIQSKDFHRSIYYFEKIYKNIERDPHLLNAMSVCLFELNDLDRAEEISKKVISLSAEYSDAHNNLGNILFKKRQFDGALNCYRDALIHNQNNYEIYDNIGVLLKAKGDLDGALEAHNSAININSFSDNSFCYIAKLYYEKGFLKKSIKYCSKAIEINPKSDLAYKYMGEIYQDAGQLDKAVISYKKHLEICPDDEASEVMMALQLRHMCDWSGYGDLTGRFAHLGLNKVPVAPWAALAIEDHPQRQFKRSEVYASKNIYIENIQSIKKINLKNGPIKIGYFSSDFHQNHPLFQLFAGVPREHNKIDFKIVGFDYSGVKPGEKEILFQSHFHDYYSFDVNDDAEILRLAVDAKLDIAIDMNGYTKNGKSDLFGKRIAPVQLNFLGFPSTMGACCYDYIVADNVVVTDDTRKFFSESILYMPNSYFPFDCNRHKPANFGNRADWGLPEDCFVYCSFNNSYKISPREFSLWMNILRYNENSVLWLYAPNEWVEVNLRSEAVRLGVDPARLIFAGRIDNMQHLARHYHADLFLDCFNCNAHTTAADALWMNLPVLTMRGDQFAARVASSLLVAVGLPELIVHNEIDYADLAVELATNGDKYYYIKSKLIKNMSNYPLFDTPLYVSHLEKGLKAAYLHHASGKDPVDIYVE